MPIGCFATGGARGPIGSSTNYDGDGDAADDILTMSSSGDVWTLHAHWAAGGSASATVPDVGIGARPLGGHDLDGDGSDEAFVVLEGPTGVTILVFRTDGCGLEPVIDDASGALFGFPITQGIGHFAGATCTGIGHIDLVAGELVDAATGLYEAGFVPYDLGRDGRIRAGFGDGAVLDAAEVGAHARLGCGSLPSSP